MTIKKFEEILKNNEGLERYGIEGTGATVTYDSLFKNDYVAEVHTGEEIDKLLNKIYSRKPSRLEDNIGAIARTKDNNYWVIVRDPEKEHPTLCRLKGYTYLPPYARFDNKITIKANQ